MKITITIEEPRGGNYVRPDEYSAWLQEQRLKRLNKDSARDMEDAFPADWIDSFRRFFGPFPPK